MRFIVALFLTTGCFSAAFASPIYGLLSIASDKLYIVQEKQRFEISPTSVEVLRDLTRLSSGDFVALEGYYNLNEKKVFVNSVDWVGLRKLLGSWRSADKKIFEFQDFTTLMLHNYEDNTFPVSRRNRTGAELDSIQMNYRMAPGTGSSWTLFLSEGKRLYLGRINLSGPNLNITFFDSNTGNVIKTLRLVRQSFYLAFYGAFLSDEYF